VVVVTIVVVVGGTGVVVVTTVVVVGGTGVVVVTTVVVDVVGMDVADGVGGTVVGAAVEKKGVYAS
jgi:hypothetical protein